MREVRGGDGGRICDGSKYDSAWGSGRDAAELENIGHGGRSAGLSDGISGQGRPADLPGGGMTGPSSDEDGDAGSLTIPACPGHHGHYGGGKPPSPTVNPMRHTGPPAVTECQAPCHSSVCQRRGAKEAAASRGRAKGELGEGLISIQGASGKCNGA